MGIVSALWDFSEVEASDSTRAARLSAAPTETALADIVLDRLQEAIGSNRLRVGMDESSRNKDDLRLTLQFHVGEALSDQFFNATTGYRAQFRRDWQCGLKYNKLLIERIRSALKVFMPEQLLGRRLSEKFDDMGPMTVSREQACDSLNPELSKVWFCGRLLHEDGRIEQLPAGVTGPRLRLSNGGTWAAIWRDEASAWLDVKGAFLSAGGSYQIKDPMERAKKLSEKGEA